MAVLAGSCIHNKESHPMFTLMKVWFRPQAALVKAIKSGEIDQETFEYDERLIPKNTKLYLSPVSLLIETAMTGNLHGKVVFYDPSLPPTGLSPDQIDSLRTGDVECDDLEPFVDLLPISESTESAEFTITAIYAICFEETIVRVGGKAKMTAMLHEFNTILEQCESSEALKCINYSGLFDAYTQGCNWIAAAASIH